MNELEAVDELTYRAFYWNAVARPDLIATMSGVFNDGGRMRTRFESEFCATHRERKQPIWSDGSLYCETCVNASFHNTSEGLEDCHEE